MKKLWVMCGIPGSGKSTFIKEKMMPTLKADRTLLVSRDDIRFSLVKEGEPYFSKEKEVFNTFVDKIAGGLTDSDIENVIVDATHISVPSRRKLLNALGKSIKNVEINAITLNTSIDKCIDRNAKREGRSFVPVESIINMNNSFVEPSLEEGFDSICVVTDSDKMIVKVNR